MNHFFDENNQDRTLTSCRQFSPLNQRQNFGSSVDALESHPSSKTLRIFCKTCEAEVGLYQVLQSSVTLFKWQIFCDSQPLQRTPTSSQCLSAILSASMARSGSSKAIIIPPQAGLEESYTIHMWVLNPSVSYSSSLTNARGLAMKVLWKRIDPTKALKMLESFTSDVQEVSLPDSTIREIGGILLSQTRNLLPPPERIFQGWQVSLLQRWEEVDDKQQ